MNGLRVACVADLQRLRRLDEHCFDDSWSEATWQQLLKDPRRYRCWLLETPAREAIAYLLFSRILDESELLRIGVCRDWRGQGLARQMLTAAQSWLEADGIRSFYLEVRDSNQGAQQLYRRCGWQCSGRRRNYYSDASGSEDALLFNRCLG